MMRKKILVVFISIAFCMSIDPAKITVILQQAITGEKYTVELDEIVPNLQADIEKAFYDKHYQYKKTHPLPFISMFIFSPCSKAQKITEEELRTAIHKNEPIRFLINTDYVTKRIIQDDDDKKLRFEWHRCNSSLSIDVITEQNPESYAKIEARDLLIMLLGHAERDSRVSIRKSPKTSNLNPYSGSKDILSLSRYLSENSEENEFSPHET